MAALRSSSSAGKLQQTRVCRAELSSYLHRGVKICTNKVDTAPYWRLSEHQGGKTSRTWKEEGVIHLNNPADEDVVALVVDSVSHQNLIHHWNENLVLW